MSRPRDCQEAFPRDWLLARLTDPEAAASQTFQRRRDLLELLRLLPAVVEGDKLIVDERGLILDGQVTRHIQSVNFR